MSALTCDKHDHKPLTCDKQIGATTCIPLTCDKHDHAYPLTCDNHRCNALTCDKQIGYTGTRVQTYPVGLASSYQENQKRRQLIRLDLRPQLINEIVINRAVYTFLNTKN